MYPILGYTTTDFPTGQSLRRTGRSLFQKAHAVAVGAGHHELGAVAGVDPGADAAQRPARPEELGVGLGAGVDPVDGDVNRHRREIAAAFRVTVIGEVE